LTKINKEGTRIALDFNVRRAESAQSNMETREAAEKEVNYLLLLAGCRVLEETPSFSWPDRVRKTGERQCASGTLFRLHRGVK
jgi:hypothetical protein